MTLQQPDTLGGEIVPLEASPDEPDTFGQVEARVPDSVPASGTPSGTAPAYDLTAQPGERRPIIPVVLQRENIRGTVAMQAGLGWHRFRYHSLRSPVYLVALAVFSVLGIVRVAGKQVRWWWLLESHTLRNAAAAAGNTAEYLRLHKQAKGDRKVRGLVLLGQITAILIAVLVLYAYGPWWAWALAVMAVVPFAAHAGRPAGHSIISPAVVPPQYEIPSPEVITRALASLGVPGINAAMKDGRGIVFVSDVMRDGPGWGVQLDLPHGVTAGHVIAKRAELASGLRRPLSATWPGGVPAEHEGRVDLWIGFHDMSKSKPVKHPLLKAGTADIFQSIPFGTDPRLRPVSVPMFEVNWLIGSAPGQGKTNAVRNLAAAVALDPIADLWIHEHAGKGDLEPFAQVCHRYVSGLDDGSIEYARESARLLRSELDRRAKIFGKLPRDVKPEGKLTRELATKLAGLRPVVAFFDECQNIFMHPAFGQDAADDLAYVIRVGRAYGVIVILATQRPDKDSVPTQVSGLVTARFCLQVPDQNTNDMIMGTSAYKSGYNSMLFRPKTDAGLGWLKADGIPQIVRTYKLDLEPSARIAARARAIRERAGVLSGYALGEDFTEVMPRDVLADVLEVFGDRDGLQWDELADRLAASFPDRWMDAEGGAVSAQCRSLGVPSVNVKADGQVLKGCRRSVVEKAQASR